jgi:hypothetical protein
MALTDTKVKNVAIYQLTFQGLSGHLARFGQRMINT